MADPSVNITGIDCIWHNLYGESNFTTIRKWYENCDLNELLLFISDHVRRNLYKVVAICATKHMVVLTCACEKDIEELPDGWTLMK